MNIAFSRRWKAAGGAGSGAVVALALWLNLHTHSIAATYFVHPTLGDDGYSGTSEQTPWRTLDRAAAAQLRPGDQLLLAAGQMFPGQLTLAGLAGRAGSPIVISAYDDISKGGNSLPVIDARGFVAGVNLRNSSHVELRNLEITANGSGPTAQPLPPGATMRCGVLVEATQPGNYGGFGISNLVIHDVFFENPGFIRKPEETRTANGTQHYGWGIRFLVHSPRATMSDIQVRDCQIRNVSHTGLKFTAPSNGLRNLRVEGIHLADTGGPGVQMSGVSGGHFRRLDVNRSGSTNDTRNWKRGSGLWTWGSNGVLIERSRFQNANGPGDSAGVHIDYHCRNVMVQYNFSANNAGGFCEILGNNFNCAYRYNISVNDGGRVKGKAGAFQEGKTFWLSGYTGGTKPRQGPFNTYFYNNTIYVSKGLTAKIAVSPTTKGLLIANNIFCFEGASQLVAGDQSRQEQLPGAPIPDVVFRNNLYLRAGNWPAAVPIQDAAPLTGDPQFPAPGGMQAEDYIPRNIQLVRNRGIHIPRIPGDRAGLPGGLKMDLDILDHRVDGVPDLGAIEITEETNPRPDSNESFDHR